MIRMVPPIPMYTMIPCAAQAVLGVRAGLFDTYTGLGLLYLATTLPFVIRVMLSIIGEVPYTLGHGAGLAGAGHIYNLRRVVLPPRGARPSENLSPQRHPPVGAEKA